MANPEHSSEHTMATPAVTGSVPSPFVAPPRRSEAQRAEASQALAELTERARDIAQRASSALVAAFKDVVADPATAGELSVESTRDLVQYLQRRGQLTPEDAERLIRSAEAVAQRRPAHAAKPVKPTVKTAPAKAPAKSAAKKSAPTGKAPAARKPAAAKKQTKGRR